MPMENVKWGRVIFTIVVGFSIWVGFIGVVVTNFQQEPDSLCGGKPQSVEVIDGWLFDETVRSLDVEHTDNVYWVWVGYGSGGAGVYTYDNGEWSKEQCAGPEHLTDKPANDNIGYNGSRFYATDQDGIWQLLPNGDWVQYTRENGGIGDNRGYSLYVEPLEGRLLVTTYEGIYVYYPEDDKFIPFTVDGKLLTGYPLMSQAFHAITYCDGTWLLGSIDKGLYTVSAEGVFHFDIDGMSILKDNYWLGVDNEPQVSNNIRDLECVGDTAIIATDGGSFTWTHQAEQSISGNIRPEKHFVQVNVFGEDTVFSDYINGTFINNGEPLIQQSSNDSGIIENTWILATNEGLRLVPRQ